MWVSLVPILFTLLFFLVQTNIKPCRVDTCGTCSSSAIARNALRDDTGVKDACCPACEPLTGQISSQNSGTATATCTLGCGVTSYTGSFFTPFGFYFDEESGDLVDTADPDADVSQ